MAKIDFTVKDHLAIVTLDDGENRFNPDFLDAFLNVLDRLLVETEASTLVVTSGHEKIFSNGIDLDWLVPVFQKGDFDATRAFLYRQNELFKRVVSYPMVTVAAISGHAFGGGAILSCAFDFRFMRSDRGFFCFPEVDLGIPFLPGMNALLKKAIPMYMVEEMQMTGERLTAAECERHHIITKACPGEKLMPEVCDFAQKICKKRSVLQEMKNRLHGHIVTTIDTEDPAYIEKNILHIS